MAFWKRPLMTYVQEQALVDAIGAAEAGNRGEVRVHIEARCQGPDAFARAEAIFGLLEMHQTEEGTGVLLYVAVEDRKAAVYAGPGVYGQAADGFWDDVIALVADGYRVGKPVEGLQGALNEIGQLLREVVPGEDTGGNELPNEVTSS